MTTKIVSVKTESTFGDVRDSATLSDRGRLRREPLQRAADMQKKSRPIVLITGSSGFLGQATIW